MVQRPTITGIVAWANERFAEHRAGLLALALVAAIAPIARWSIVHDEPARPYGSIGGLMTWTEALVLLLCNAAMVLLVLRPKGAAPIGAVREAVDAAPRLVLVKIVTAVLQWLPGIVLTVAAYGLRNGTLAIVIWLLTVPLAFVCGLAFASAVVEGFGAFEAISAAFRRARVSGIPVVFGLSVVFAVIERGVPGIFALIANAIYPPPDVPISLPFPIPIPDAAFPTMMQPGEFGSAVPWGAHIVMLVANVPFFAYVTVLYAGAALSFADTDPAPPETNELVTAQISVGAEALP